MRFQMDKFNHISEKVTYVPFCKQPSEGYSDDQKRKNTSILESLYWQTIGWVHTPPFIKAKFEPDSQFKVPKSTIESQKYKFYTKKSFSPKLQIEDNVPYGFLPRDVASDIEKRRFAQQDFQTILKDMGIENDALLPRALYYKDRIEVLKTECSEGIPFQPFLSLDMFDDAWYYDAYSPEEWLALGDSEDGRKPLPALAFMNLVWCNVMVIDYDSEKKLYLVRRILDNEQDNDSFHDDDNSEDMWIPRIYLKFDSEEPLQFAKRLQTALYTRHIVEESLRMTYYVECMPKENCPEWSSEDLDAIIEIARSSHSLQSNPRWLEEYLIKKKDELQVEYKRAYNYMCYMETTNQKPSLISDFRSENLLDPDTNGHFRDHTFPFEETLDSFKCKTFYTSAEVIRALTSVEESILSLRDKSLYYFVLNEIQTLDNFVETQQSQLSHIKNYVHGSWMSEISNAISINLKDFGKGQYDLDQTVLHTLKLTKLGKLLKVVAFKMQDVIRYLVVESLEKYVSLFILACSNVKNIDDTFKWTESLSSDKYKPIKHPVFEVNLEIEGDHLRFDTNLQKYEEKIRQLFDEGLQITNDLPRIEKFVMKKMLYNPDDKLDTVGEKEKHIIRWKKHINYGIKKAIIVATAYIRAYDDPLKSFKTDPINYVKQLARQKATCDKLKQVIEMHNMEKIALENTIPSSIDIGPFRLATESVRVAAMKKHEQLADAVLNYFYTKLRQYMEDINNEFLVLIDRIEQPTGNIEDLLEKKQWCRTVPKRIEKICVEVNQLRSDVKLISTFNRNMGDEDVNSYWQIQKLPQETMKKLHHRVSKFEEERKEHRNHLKTDQAILKSNLQKMQRAIADLVRHSDLKEVAERAIEIRKVRKNLSNFDEQSQLYQKRERLFGMPITDYSQIAVLSEALLPYEKFWLSAGDFNKYKELDKAQLSSTDPSQLKADMEKYYSNLLESLEFFDKVSHPKIRKSVIIVLRDVEDFIKKQFPDFLFE